MLGETEQGEAVELNRRAAESDLLVYVNINLVTMDGGHKSVPIGLGTYRSLRAHHNVHTMRHSRSFMDPPSSELHRSARRQGELVEGAVPTFHVETTLNNDMYSAARCRSWPSRRARWTRARAGDLRRHEAATRPHARSRRAGRSSSAWSPPTR